MRCGGLVVTGYWLLVSVPASRSLVPGSNLGPGSPHSAVCGAADRTVNNVLKPLALVVRNFYFLFIT